MDGYSKNDPELLVGTDKFLKLLKVALVIFFAAVLVYVGFWSYKLYKVSSIAPQSLIAGTKANLNVVKSEAMPVMKIEANEVLAKDSVVYTEKKYQFEVIKEFYDKIVNSGWVAVDGSIQKDNVSIFKLTNGKDLVFLALEGGLSEPITKVKIFKVVKNN